MSDDEQFWSVYGGIGGRRIAQNLNHTDAEAVAHDFARRTAGLTAPSRIWVERQSHRYERGLS